MPSYKLRALWLAIGWLLIALVVYVSLMSAPPSIDIPAGDKLAHVLAYATLALWFFQLHPARRQPILAAGFITMGVMLEFFQGSTAFRSFEFIDMAANAGGVILGWLLGKTRLSSTLHVIEKQIIRM